MVRVITIRDDVYAQLSDLKIKNGMSFSEAIDHLLKENNVRKKGLLDFVGVIDEGDVDRNSSMFSRKGWKHD
ncbi:MAG: antitoxin VapB family protein [Candidatus ainarchaeum sp.]|nr:antitoxin VapB family protein [Candidatus ainarchaeum sp.]MDD5096010.1 antitoxin VapB family protein [Candidatus ainarchaeum sp.]